MIADSDIVKLTPEPTLSKQLADQDSNLDKQDQNLLCYRYTIGQGSARTEQRLCDTRRCGGRSLMIERSGS